VGEGSQSVALGRLGEEQLASQNIRKNGPQYLTRRWYQKDNPNGEERRDEAWK
jgi:hypothetical protein